MLAFNLAKKLNSLFFNLLNKIKRLFCYSVLFNFIGFLSKRPDNIFLLIYSALINELSEL